MNIKETLLKEGYVLYPIKGNSMYPMLNEKTDLVRIELLKGEMKIGDVVLFEKGEGYFTLHRIVKIRKNDIDLLGDNVGYLDMHIPKEKVVGILTGVIRCGDFSPLKEEESLAFFQKSKMKYLVKRKISVLKYYLKKGLGR